jgi:hypothetical protein
MILYMRACNSVDREYAPGLDSPSPLLVRGWPGVNGTTFRAIDDVALYQHHMQLAVNFLCRQVYQFH